MTTCLGKSCCSFGLLCVSFVNVYQFLSVSFPFWLEGGMWELIVCLVIAFLLTLRYKGFFLIKHHFARTESHPAELKLATSESKVGPSHKCAFTACLTDTKWN